VSGLLGMMCDTHSTEPVKYFCRDCRVGVCPECIVIHSKHDFVFADEGAAFEVKQQLKSLNLNVSSRNDEYSILLKETEAKIKEIDKWKEDEVAKVRYYF
jgi:hypothetical protein